MATISTNNVVLARFAGAMYNLALDYNTDQQVLASFGTTDTSSFFNTIYARDFGNSTNAAVAAMVSANLLLTGNLATIATNFITGQLNAAPVAARGAVIAGILNAYAQMSSDPSFGPSVILWETQVSNAVNYSTNSANTTMVAMNTLGTTTNPGAFTLTNDTDIATANIFTAGLVYTPGGNDRINALQDEDQLTGTGTAPTLNATLGNANDNGATIITPKLTSVEVINVAFTGSGGAAVKALDLQDATGQTAVNITRISQASNTAEVGNIMTPASTLSLANTNANSSGTAEFSYGAGVLKGLNTGTLGLNNVQIGTLNIGENTSFIGGLGVGLNGFEELTINSAGAAKNTVGTLNLPMDTGTAGKITITGSTDLTLAATVPVLNGTVVESVLYAGGILQSNGRLAAIDASAFTGNLTLTLAPGVLSTGKADTSGVVQNVSIIGGTGADKFILNDIVQAGDSITGGAGIDTLVVGSGGTVNSVSSILSSIENVEVRASTGGAVTVDFNKIPDAAVLLVRNEGAFNGTGAVNPDAPFGRALVTNLNNLTVAQAAALVTQHSDTGSNGILQNTINANLKSASGTSDTVSLTIAEGVNTDPRFNLILGTQNGAGFTGGVENVTIVDADTESNTVALSGVAQQTGKITLGGGVAGTFLNLDTTTAGANGGIYQYATNGSPNNGSGDANSSNAGPTVGRIIDLSGVATQDRLVAATIDASGEAANVIVRVSSNAASLVGAQAITMGSGNDTVIFDNITTVPDTRAGLTISDTVVGGEGSDTLAVDGNTSITLGASEWTNVSGFETIRLVGATAYNLTLTNNLLATNKNATTGYLAVVNDNDLFNDTGRTVAQAAVTTVTNADGTAPFVPNDAALAGTATVIDARTLSAGSKWSYNGNEGPGRSTDRFIMADANIDGNAVLDGGAIDNLTNNRGIASLDGTTVVGNGVAANTGNADVLEVRNFAVVSQGDLANISNIGTLSFTNDLAVTQVSTLQLSDSIVDNMVDSFQASASRAQVATLTTGGANVEQLIVNAIDNMNVAAATTGLTIEAGSLTDKSDLLVTLGRGANVVTTGGGQDRVVLLGNYVAGTYAVVENGVNINAQSTPGAVARIDTDNINLGGGIDTLVTYGALNLVGATLAGIELLEANSALVLTTTQFNALTSITFTGAMAHQLTIVDDSAAANTVSLDKIILAGGTLTVDLTSSFTAPAAANNQTALAGTAVRNTAGAASPAASAGFVGTTPTNGGAGGGGAVAAYTLTNGVDLYNSLTAGFLNANFGGIAGVTPTLNQPVTLTTTQANLTVADVLAFGTGADVLQFSGAVTGLTIATGSVTNGVTTTGTLETVTLDNVVNSVTITGNSQAGFVLNGGSAQDVVTFTAAATAMTVNTLGGNDIVTLTAAPAAGNIFNLGDGNDTFNAATFAAANLSVNGGNGTDTINFTNAAALNDAFFTLVSNVEIVKVLGGYTHVVDTLAGVAGIRTLEISTDAATTVNSTVAYNAISGGVLTVNAAALADANALTVNAATVATNLSVTNLTANLTATNFVGTLAVALGNNIVDDALTVTTGTGNVTFTGGDATDTVTVTANASAETITATTALSKFAFTGTANSQVFTGGTAVDTIASGAFVVTVSGGGGNDAITFSAGTVQTAVLANTAASADTITTFTAAEDKLQVSKALFAGLTSAVGAGFSVPAEFVSSAGGAAAGTNAQFDYNSTTGALSYDADGTGIGAAVLVVTLVGAPALASGNFVIVA